MKTQSAKQPKLCPGCRKLRVVVVFIIPLFSFCVIGFLNKNRKAAPFFEKNFACVCMPRLRQPARMDGEFESLTDDYTKNKDLSKDRSLFWQMTLILIETR